MMLKHMMLAFLLLVVRPGATFVASLLLVAMLWATSSILVPSSDGQELHS